MRSLNISPSVLRYPNRQSDDGRRPVVYPFRGLRRSNNDVYCREIYRLKASWYASPDIVTALHLSRLTMYAVLVLRTFSALRQNSSRTRFLTKTCSPQESLHLKPLLSPLIFFTYSVCNLKDHAASIGVSCSASSSSVPVIARLFLSTTT